MLSKFKLLIVLVLFGCTKPTPGPCDDASTATKCPPCPCAAGGTRATGGAPSTGGRATTGGAKSTGGTVSTGGSSASSCPAVAINLTPNTASAEEKKSVHRKFHKRKHRNPARAPHLQEREASALCSQLRPLGFTLDQGDQGSCTGNAEVGMLCSPAMPTPKVACNEDTADLIYQGGTCVDNACSVPCTCSSCKGAYCPATDANDNGSMGSSVSQFAVDMGWLKGYAAADSLAAIETCLQTHNPIWGVNWPNSGMNVDASCHVQFVSSQGIAGGHETLLVGLDLANGDIIGKNSWGNAWGCCIGSDCGYYRVKISDWSKFAPDGDCPAP